MPIEVHGSAAITSGILEIFDEMNQARTPEESLFWLEDGRESLAVSLDAAVLQKTWMEAAQHLFIEPATATLGYGHMSANLFPILLDVNCLKQTTSGKLFAHNRDQQRLATKLWTSLEDYPFEDGMRHPIEGIIAKELQIAKDEVILDWLKSFCTDVSRPSFAASVLQCLGRSRDVGTVSWRVELVRESLMVDNVEIRDAAVQVAESWCDAELLIVLKSHYEPEPWLRQYISDVISDLTR